MPSVFPATEELRHRFINWRIGFMCGITIVGLPFLVRTVLGFNARYYGAAESALAVATILGSIAAGALAEKLKICVRFFV